MPFAHLTPILGLGRLRPRGPNGTRDEFHIAIAIVQALICNGTSGRFFNDVDLLSRLETETSGDKWAG